MWKLVGSERLVNESGMALHFADDKGKCIQVDVRVLAGLKLICEAEDLIAGDPLILSLEDGGCTAVVPLGKEDRDGQGA